jgi:hypothetical protein
MFVMQDCYTWGPEPVPVFHTTYGLYLRILWKRCEWLVRDSIALIRISFRKLRALICLLCCPGSCDYRNADMERADVARYFAHAAAWFLRHPYLQWALSTDCIRMLHKIQLVVAQGSCAAVRCACLVEAHFYPLPIGLSQLQKFILVKTPPKTSCKTTWS